MNSYFCIVNMPGVSAREIRVLDVRDDASAIQALSPVAAEWVGFDTICLYQGERFIQVLSNPALGFPQDALALPQDPSPWAEAPEAAPPHPSSWPANQAA